MNQKVEQWEFNPDPANFKIMHQHNIRSKLEKIDFDSSEDYDSSDSCNSYGSYSFGDSSSDFGSEKPSIEVGSLNDSAEKPH